MTIRDIAALLGVSPATVSLVLNNKPGVSAQRRKTIQAALTRYGYQIKSLPETAAPPKQICCVKYRTNYENDEFSISILDAIEEYANQSGYTVSLVNISHDTYERKLLSLDYSNLKGIIFFASEISEDCLNYTLRFPLPAVYIDIFSMQKNINTVNADQRQIANLAAMHLKNHGHTSIGYLKALPERGYLGQRFSYFNDTLKSLDIHLNPQFIFSFNMLEQDLNEQLERAFSGIETFPTAFFAESDTLATSCISALKKRGFRIPNDISVVSVDNTKISQLTTPELTSIDVNMCEMGRVAVERLLQLIEDPSRPTLSIYITPSLIRRESSGPAPTP